MESYSCSYIWLAYNGLIEKNLTDRVYGNYIWAILRPGTKLHMSNVTCSTS
jgi:hypothetical protein